NLADPYIYEIPPQLKKLKSTHASFAEALHELDQRMARVPQLGAHMRAARKALGILGSPPTVRNKGRLLPVGDSGELSDSDIEVLTMPSNCTNVQAVRREKTTLYYDPLIWKLFDGTSKAIMQLHEELYFLEVGWTRRSTGEATETSMKTRWLLVEILD